MPAWVKDLLPYLQTGSAVASLKKAKAEYAPKAEGSRPSTGSKTGSDMASLKKAKIAYAPTGLAEAEGSGQSSEAEELDDQKSILTVASSAAPSTTVMSLASPTKKPAMSVSKKPAMSVSKKPAAWKVMKKPGCIQGLRKNSWKASPSFGWAKPTFATQKSYIQYKANLGDKMQLLVNCQGEFDHADVTRKLLDLVVAKPGLDKAMVLEERNKLCATWMGWKQLAWARQWFSCCNCTANWLWWSKNESWCGLHFLMNLSMCLLVSRFVGFQEIVQNRRLELDWHVALVGWTACVSAACICSSFTCFFLSCYFWSVMAGLGKAFLLLLLCGLSAAWPGQMRFFGMVCGIGSTCLLDGGGNCCQEMVLQAHGPWMLQMPNISKRSGTSHHQTHPRSQGGWTAGEGSGMTSLDKAQRRGVWVQWWSKMTMIQQLQAPPTQGVLLKGKQMQFFSNWRACCKEKPGLMTEVSEASWGEIWGGSVWGKALRLPTGWMILACLWMRWREGAEGWQEASSSSNWKGKMMGLRMASLDKAQLLLLLPSHQWWAPGELPHPQNKCQQQGWWGTFWTMFWTIWGCFIQRPFQQEHQPQKQLKHHHHPRSNWGRTTTPRSNWGATTTPRSSWDTSWDTSSLKSYTHQPNLWGWCLWSRRDKEWTSFSPKSYRVFKCGRDCLAWTRQYCEGWVWRGGICPTDSFGWSCCSSHCSGDCLAWSSYRNGACLAWSFCGRECLAWRRHYSSTTWTYKWKFSWW